MLLPTRKTLNRIIGIADSRIKELEEQLDSRPSEDEIKIKIVDTLWGDMSVPELLKWLKEKLLIKD